MGHVALSHRVPDEVLQGHKREPVLAQRQGREEILHDPDPEELVGLVEEVVQGGGAGRGQVLHRACVEHAAHLDCNGADAGGVVHVAHVLLR